MCVMRRLFLIFTITILLGACSSSIVYNNADFLVKWWVSKYIDFNPQQQPVVENTIDAWLSWHRQSEIPRYQQQLNTLKTAVATKQFSRPQLEQQFTETLTHIERIRQRIAPDVAAIGVTLDIDQLSQLFATINHERKERAEDFVKRQKKQPSRAERMMESMEEYIGPMSQSQAQIVESYVSQLNATYSLWQEYGDVSNQTARKILLSAGFDELAQQRLADFIVNQETLQPRALQAASEANKALYIDMLWAIFPTLSPRQRDELIAKIDEYLTLLQSIS